MRLLNRFRSSKLRDWWLITSPDAGSETRAEGLHFKGEPNREANGPENVHTLSIGCRRMVPMPTCMQQTYLFLPVWALGDTGMSVHCLTYEDRTMVGSSQLLKPYSDTCIAMQNFPLCCAWYLYSCTDTSDKGGKQWQKQSVPFPFLWPSRNFLLNKSLTLSGLIPKQSTAYCSTTCTLHPVCCSAFVYSVKPFVCVWDFWRSLSWRYVSDTGHIKRKFEVFRRISFLCRFLSQKWNCQTSTFFGGWKIHNASSHWVSVSESSGTLWSRMGAGGGGKRRRRRMVGGGGPRERFFLSSCLCWKHIALENRCLVFSVIVTTAVVYTICPSKI